MRPTIAALIAATLALTAPAGAADSARAKERLLPEALPPVRPADKALTTVTWAPGAPAVVLLEARQNEWVDIKSTSFLRARYFRRLKVLTEAGVEPWGDFIYELYGDWHREEFDVANHAAGGKSKRRETECVWLNYR